MDIAEKMARLTTEILAMEEELRQYTAQHKLSPADEKILLGFKEALDTMRHAVWPHVLAAQQHCEANAIYAVQSYRMTRVKKMLEDLRQDAEALGQQQKAQLFFSEIQRLAKFAPES